MSLTTSEFDGMRASNDAMTAAVSVLRDAELSGDAAEAVQTISDGLAAQRSTLEAASVRLPQAGGYQVTALPGETPPGNPHAPVQSVPVVVPPHLPESAGPVVPPDAAHDHGAVPGEQSPSAPSFPVAGMPAASGMPQAADAPERHDDPPVPPAP